jgi:hypothetical protein
MSTLNTLKLVAAKPQRENNPVIQRRQKLLAKLDEQIALAAAKAAGTVYTAMRSKRVKDDTGNVTVVQQPKRVKAWFWTVEGGKVCVAVKYGNKVVELAKGRTAVETTAAELTATLAVLRKAVESGEIDAQIEAVSAGVRRGFKR